MAFRARYGSLGGANDFVDGFAAVRLFLADSHAGQRVALCVTLTQALWH